MIGEPEMADEAGGGLPGDLLSSSDDLGSGGGTLRRPRPWLWAVGGIAAASAVWAAVLHGTAGTAPDLHGYHLRGNPCSGDALSPLKDAVGTRDFAASDATVSSGPALDKLACTLVSVSSADEGLATTYTITLSLELHRRTDPRAEFENIRRAQVSHRAGTMGGNAVLAVADSGFTSAADVHPVMDVGDEGYLLSDHDATQTLEVLHGGAVFTLQVTGYIQWNSTGEADAEAGDPPKDPDLTRVRPAMTTAMRHLMASLAS